ncbi:MAG: Stk1 family PASTA domain-containing Ser/Thr kinase [Candidatus Faecousia sp.]|nr:Stk1 family PASTA domain-containing Ser/Thr kinase [Candidatus Faecousia sp.]
MDQYIGRLLDGRYEILEVIGTGGMAVVYKARCHRLNRLVAIKILKDEFARDEEFRRRFRAEGEAVAMLSHPNIVQVYDVSTSDSANFIVMELIDGISLKEYMEKKGVLNWKETLHFSLQIAKGLEHAHSRGIIHRDIKPHNIMVLKNGSVKVMDFGIARVMNKSNTLTKEALGSVHYISPEQAKGGHTDNRSDLYSLGVVMYEMMAGRPPYDGESAVSVAIQHINGGAPAPSVYNPNIPKGLEQIIMKAMALEVRDRYVSATEMLQDMEEFRKNPAIVFDYHTLLDDATRKLTNAGIPMTTAEKKVRSRTGEHPVSQPAPQRRTGTAARSVTSQQDSEIVSRVQQRHREEQKKKEKERSRVATTAIVICSAVAVFAIIVFLIALFSGALLDQEKDTVEVPYLTGGLYSQALVEANPDFNIRLLPQQYNDSHPKDEIIAQEPAGGSKVQRGSDIWITVSMGPEPEVRTLDNFVGADAEEAYKLLESQGFKPLKKREASYVYGEGIVTRTDPAADSEVTAGQTIYIYVSTGPEVVEVPMPNVIGLELTRAKELMNQLGFTNVRYEPTESSRPENEVVYQSVAKNETVDVSAEVIVQYSSGGVETAPESGGQAGEPDATVPPFSVSWVVPESDEEYRLDVCLGGTKDVLFSKLIPPGAKTVLLDLSGSGVVYYDLYINGEFAETKTVDFTPKKAESGT